IKSISRPGLSVVYGEVDERVTDPNKEFDDIKIKLDSLTDLPEGAGPMQYIKEFGETSALMLTVASPPAGEEQLAVLSAQIGNAIAPGAVHIAFCTLAPLDHSFLREAAELFSRQMRDQGVGGQVHLVDGNGFVLIRLKAEPGISERSIAKL